MKLKSVLKRIFRGDLSMDPQLCYGQEGEDLILDRMLDRQSQGFYVDVGAHHPARFSNTYLFYRNGWSGINIDAEPGAMEKFRKVRPRDINIECGVGSKPGRLAFYRFNEPALNTFDQHEARLKDSPPYKLIDTVDVEVQRLDELLMRYLPKNQQIDFLSIDVEGKDLEVLQSSNWEQFRPRIVLAETLRTDILQMRECPVVQFLGSVGYRPVSKSYNTTFFVAEDQ